MGLEEIMSQIRRGSTNPGGPQTPAQADLETVAKGFGFPETMIDKFGDTLGTRPRRFSDAMRDGALAAITGDVTAPLKIQQQVAKSFAEAVDKKRERALQDREERRQRNKDLLGAFNTAKTFPPGQRAAAMKALTEAQELTPHPFMTNFLTSDDFDTQAFTEKFAEAIEDGNLDDVEMADLMKDPTRAIPMIEDFKSIQAKDANINQALARTAESRTDRSIAKRKEKREQGAFDAKLSDEAALRQKIILKGIDATHKAGLAVDEVKMAELNRTADLAVADAFPKADVNQGQGAAAVDGALQGKTETEINAERARDAAAFNVGFDPERPDLAPGGGVQLAESAQDFFGTGQPTPPQGAFGTAGEAGPRQAIAPPAAPLAPSIADQKAAITQAVASGEMTRPEGVAAMRALGR